jgi:arginyl-tRNA synthetase
VRAADVAGPGFINFRLTGAQLQALLERVLRRTRPTAGNRSNRRGEVIVEFVSANPTGPLHVAHGRGAALGDGIARSWSGPGHAVYREFYVNDAGVQIDRLAESVDARWRQLQGEEAPIPEGGYHGDYVRDLAREADEELADRLVDAPAPTGSGCSGSGPSSASRRARTGTCGSSASSSTSGIRRAACTGRA